MVLGGPFPPHIERILRDKASSLSSTVLSACDPGNKRAIRGLSKLYGKPCQSCDIVIQIEKDFQLVCTCGVGFLLFCFLVVDMFRYYMDMNLHLVLMQFIELFDVRLSMLGSHQLQNAVTATCASLCLRDQGAELVYLNSFCVIQSFHVQSFCFHVRI